ncbi:MAG: urea ABC transporter permease subunit UrtB [Dehalococcoidia bacterium]|nr:urea ABC transporter permease subunit UrtB [Dehalococcoidia bacterium]
MEFAVLQAFNAISVSSILLLIALGLAFSFGLMGVINMAHGEFIMIGAYTAYAIQNLAAPAMVNGVETQNDLMFLLALPVAFLVAGAGGMVLERLLIRHLYERALDTLLATWGVGLMLQQLARFIFGAPNVQVVTPSWLTGGLVISDDVTLPAKRMFIVALVTVCIAAITFFLYRTAAGRRLRAVMQNRDMASSLGVATRQVDSLTFALGSGLAGVAGCAVALIGPIGPALGTYYIVDAFMVVIFGGVGQLLGTVIAALGIGSLNVAFELGSTAVVGKVMVFVMVILFLQWKPSGLLALRTR